MEVSIRISKSSRTLELMQNGAVTMTCKIALGWEPDQPKRAEGDGRTPEGRYYVCTKNEQSKYCLSLGLSYPSQEDARLALLEGRIDREAYDKIAQANQKGLRPPWNTPLGGFIMIHGGGADEDWTAGCVAVSDADIQTIFPLCPLGTPVEFLP